MEISFGALDFYPRAEIEYSLTEKVTLTEQGKVKALLEARFGVIVNQHPDLERAIEQFETLCNLRHALVHSGGVVNSRNAKNLGHESSRSGCRVQLGPGELQLAASVCMDLVRAAHAEVGKHIFWRWVVSGHLKGNRSRDRSKITQYAGVFLSKRDAGDSATSTTDEMHALIKTVRADIELSKLKAALAS